MSATEMEKPGAANTRLDQTDYGRLHRVLRAIKRPACAVCWAIEQWSSRIETKHELDKWNRHAK
jgi:hypothetical protein